MNRRNRISFSSPFSIIFNVLGCSPINFLMVEDVFDFAFPPIVSQGNKGYNYCCRLIINVSSIPRFNQIQEKSVEHTKQKRFCTQGYKVSIFDLLCLVCLKALMKSYTEPKELESQHQRTTTWFPLHKKTFLQNGRGMADQIVRFLCLDNVFVVLVVLLKDSPHQ